MLAAKFDFDYKPVVWPADAAKKAAPRILRSWGGYLMRESRANIREGHDIWGVAFKPHASATSRRLFEDLWAKKTKRNIGVKTKTYQRLEAASKKILYRTGTLFRSVVAAYSASSVTVGSLLPYAWVHNFGAVIKTTRKQSVWMWANLFGRIGNPFRFKKITQPQRQFVGITPKYEKVCTLNAEIILANMLNQENRAEAAN